MPFPRRHFDRACVICGKTYWPVSTMQRFCSPTCRAAGAVKPRSLCPVCQERPRRPQGLTCSAACGYRYRQLRTRKPRPCAECGAEMLPVPSNLKRGLGKFCSRACYLTVHARRPAFVSVDCKCGTTFRRTQAAVNRTVHSFCSSRCARTFNRGENSPNWRGGHDPNRGPGWQRIAAEVRERDGYRCRRCGKTQEDEGVGLSVDHVIPWRSFTSAEEANDPSNLVALCRSCHGKKQRAERLWLQGDVLDMWRYQIAVSEPWKVPA